MKNLIRIALMAVMLTAWGSTLWAQQDNRQRITREELAEKQARHIAEQMAMSDSTAQQFVEVYCRQQAEIWALGPRERKQDRRDRKELTDAETDQMLKDRFAHSEKILDIRQKYYEEYSKFLTPRQINRVYELERQMMTRLGKKRQDSARGRRR